MKKRIISMLLVCLLCTLLPTQAVAAALDDAKAARQTGAENPFTDVKDSDWFYDGAQYARVNGFFNGTSATTFSPNGTMTRGMFVTVLGRMAGVDPADYSGKTGFSDVPESKYYAPYVEWAARYGITEGTGNGKFSPNQLINRQQMATFFVRYFEKFGVRYETDANVTTTPADLASVASYARDAVQKLWKNGLLNGDGKNFNPTGKASRAQASVLSMRIDKAVEIWYSEPGVASERVSVEPPAADSAPAETQPIGGGTGSSSTTYYEVQFALGKGVAADGVTLPETKTYVRDTKISALPTPFKRGGIFLGWYYDAEMTDAAGIGDTLRKNTTLYAKMAEGSVNLARMETPNYITATDVDSSSFVLKLNGLTQSNEADLSITNVSANNAPVAFTVSGGTVILTDGWKPGQTYKAELSEDSEAVFVYNGAQPGTIRVFNILTQKAPVQQLTLDSGVKFIPKTAVSQMSDALSGLFTVSLERGTDGETKPVQQVAQTGTFTYSGSGIAVGDTVAIYEGTNPKDRTQNTTNDAVVYVEITRIEGTTYTYKTADSEDVLFTPDVLPVSTAADTDKTDGNTLTTAAATFDYSADKFAEMGLDSTTSVDVGDFLAFYSGSLETQSGTPDYKEITSVSRDETTGVYTIAYTDASPDAVYAAMDIYATRKEEVKLSEGEKKAIENDMENQALNSGFVDEAATYLTALALETDGFRELSGDMDLKSYSVTLDDGTPLGEDEMSLMGGRASITEKSVQATVAAGYVLQHFDGSSGVRAELAMTFEVEVDIGGGNKVVITVQAIFEQEVLLSVNVSGGAIWKVKWIFPYIYDYNLNANIDVGTYTGIGITATARTQGEEDEEFDWKPATSSGAEQKILDIGKQITDLMEKKEEFLGQKLVDEDGEEVEWTGSVGGGLAEKYASMIENADDSWIEIFREEIFSTEGSVDPFHILAFGVSADFVVSANMYVTMGMTFEYANAKRYNFSLMLFHKQSTNETVDLEESHYQFDFYVMGTAGIRAGVELEVAVGLFSLKLDSIGICAEAGAYAQLWGYFYYHLLWTESAGKVSEYSGAMHIEIGMYLEITFKAQLFSSDKLTYQPTIYEKQWPLLTIGEAENIYGFAELDEADLVYDIQSARSFALPGNLFDMVGMDLQSGDLYDGEDNPAKSFDDSSESRFAISFSDPHFSYNGENNTVTVDPGGTVELSAEMTIRWKNASLAFTSRPIQRVLSIHWSDPANSRYISFDSRGGSAVKMIIAGEGGKITWPAAPGKTGYDFAGWFTDPGCNSPYTALNTAPGAANRMPAFDDGEKGITLYAKWTPASNSYTVKTYHQIFNSEHSGDYVLQSSVVINENKQDPQIKTGSRIDVLSKHAPQLTGYSVERKLSDATATVDADGTTVVKVYYKMNTHDLVFSYGTFKTVDTPDVTYQDRRFGSVISAPTLNIGGYLFAGWKDENGKAVDFANDNVTMPDRDYKLTAQWTPSQDTPYRVEYYIQDVAAGSSKYYYSEAQANSGTTGSAVAISSLPVPVGCTYQRATVGGSETTSPTILADGSLVIKLYFDRTKNAVTFDSNGGSTVAVQNVRYGGKASQPEAPTLNGHTFAGWYTDSDLQHAYDFNSAVIAPVTLYASWGSNSYSVAFDANSGSGSMSPMPFTYGTAQNLTGNTFERTGYTFAGWASSADGAKEYDDGAAVNNLTAEHGVTVTLYAKWTAKEYNITYELGGGTFAEDAGRPTKHTYGAATALTAQPAKLGYTFAGWYTDSAFGGSALPMLGGTDYTADITLYAKWAKATDTAYTVEHYFEDLSGNYVIDSDKTENRTGTTGAEITAQVLTVTGFSENTTHASRNPSGVIAADGSTVLKRYYARQSNTLTWAGYAGVVLATATVKYGAALPAYTAAAPTRTGYTFANTWTRSDSASGNTMPASALTLTANWTANTYTVTFDANATDGSVSPTSKSVTYDGAYGTLPTPTSTDKRFSFTGWYDAKTGGTKIEESALVGITASQTLYAQWTQDGFTLIVTSANTTMGSVSGGGTYTKGGAATLTATPNAGYHFTGWAGAASSTDNPLTVSDIQADAAYTASFAVNTYTVQFNANGGSGEAMSDLAMTYGVSKNLTDCAYTRSGYTFAGWSTNQNATTAAYSDGQSVNNLTAEHEGAVTLYAVWTREGYTITYTLTNGALPTGQTNPASYTVDSETFSLPTPTREGYTFLGWTGSNGTAPQTAVTVSKGTTGHLNYTANWSANTNTAYRVEHYFENLSGVYAIDNGKTESKTGATGAEVTAQVLAVDGFHENTTHTGRNPDGTIAANGTTVLKRYYARNQYAVTVTDGVSLTGNQMFGQTVTIQAGSKTGCDFGGWTVTSGDVTLANANDNTTTFAMPNKAVVVTANWTPHTYSVVFAGNGGSGEMEAQAFTYGTAQNLTANTFLRTGYSFTGWKVGETTYGDAASVSNLTAEQGGTVTLTAQWTICTYSITYALNEGSMEGAYNEYTVDTETFSLPTPTREGYIFLGWTGSNGETPQAEVTVAKGATGDRSYTANWESAVRTLTLRDYDSGVEIGTLSSADSDPTLPMSGTVGEAKVYTVNWYTSNETGGTPSNYESGVTKLSEIAKTTNTLYGRSYSTTKSGSATCLAISNERELRYLARATYTYGNSISVDRILGSVGVTTLTPGQIVAKLTANITLSKTWDTPIKLLVLGTDSIDGCGFDGGGYTITMNNAASTNMTVPLFQKFGEYSGGTAVLKNLTVKSAKASFTKTGGILTDFNSGTIQDCVMDGNTISGGTDVGFIAYENSGTIDDCGIVQGSIQGVTNAGGVVVNNSGKISGDSTSLIATITATTNAGGVAVKNTGTISTCNIRATITAGTTAGGVAAANETGGTITSCNTLIPTSGIGGVNATGASGYAGGVAGTNSGSISACVNYVNISAPGSNGMAGGIAGLNSTILGDTTGATTMTNYGNVTAGWYAGGIVGRNTNEGAIWYCEQRMGSSAPQISGSKGAGGIVGDLDGTDSTCHYCSVFSGNITSSTSNGYTGGIAGEDAGDIYYCTVSQSITRTGYQAGTFTASSVSSRCHDCTEVS